MKEASMAMTSKGQTAVTGFRRANWLIEAEPYSRSTGSEGCSDDVRLKAALKRAVERDLAPRNLIDSIRNKIRNNDEPR